MKSEFEESNAQQEKKTQNVEEPILHKRADSEERRFEEQCRDKTVATSAVDLELALETSTSRVSDLELDLEQAKSMVCTLVDRTTSLERALVTRQSVMEHVSVKFQCAAFENMVLTKSLQHLLQYMVAIQMDLRDLKTIKRRFLGEAGPENRQKLQSAIDAAEASFVKRGHTQVLPNADGSSLYPSISCFLNSRHIFRKYAESLGSNGTRQANQTTATTLSQKRPSEPLEREVEFVYPIYDDAWAEHFVDIRADVERVVLTLHQIAVERAACTQHLLNESGGGLEAVGSPACEQRGGSPQAARAGVRGVNSLDPEHATSHASHFERVKQTIRGLENEVEDQLTTMSKHSVEDLQAYRLLILSIVEHLTVQTERERLTMSLGQGGPMADPVTSSEETHVFLETEHREWTLKYDIVNDVLQRRGWTFTSTILKDNGHVDYHMNLQQYPVQEQLSILLLIRLL
jgi:hypothetical protein